MARLWPVDTSGDGSLEGTHQYAAGLWYPPPSVAFAYRAIFFFSPAFNWAVDAFCDQPRGACVMLNFAIAMEATPISFPYHSLGLWGAPSHLDSGISASQRLLTMLAESAVARGNEGWVTRMSNITSGRKNAGTFVATATWPATMIALLQFRNRHCVYPFRQSGLVSECCCCVRSPFNTVQVSTETANQHAPR